MPWDCEWNGVVRDETAKRENDQPASPGTIPPLGNLLHQRFITTRALLRLNPVFKDKTAYVRAQGRTLLVFEFVKEGRRWHKVGIGRAEISNYLGLFPKPDTL